MMFRTFVTYGGFIFSVMTVYLPGDPHGVDGIRVPPGVLARELGAAPGEGIWAVGEQVAMLLFAIRRRQIVLWAP